MFSKKGFETILLLLAILYALTVAADFAGAGCPVRMNTHYGYVRKIKLLKHPKQTRCNGLITERIVFDRVRIDPIIGPNWAVIEGRERVGASAESTHYAGCNTERCWEITKEEFLERAIDSGLRQAIHTDGYDTKAPVALWVMVEVL